MKASLIQFTSDISVGGRWARIFVAPDWDITVDIVGVTLARAGKAYFVGGVGYVAEPEALPPGTIRVLPGTAIDIIVDEPDTGVALKAPVIRPSTKKTKPQPKRTK